MALMLRLKKLASHSACVNSELLLGDLFFYSGDLGQARFYYLAALNYARQNVYAVFNLGRVYLAEQKYDSASVYFSYAESLKTNGNFVIDRTKELEAVTGKSTFDIEYKEIVFNDAMASFYSKKFDDAIRKFDYCISSVQRNDPELLLYRGLTYLELKDLQKACSDFKEATENGSEEAYKLSEKYCSK
jgi:tetratricopeptide (TPR) repeat protein